MTFSEATAAAATKGLHIQRAATDERWTDLREVGRAMYFFNGIVLRLGQKVNDDWVDCTDRHCLRAEDIVADDWEVLS